MSADLSVNMALSDNARPVYKMIRIIGAASVGPQRVRIVGRIEGEANYLVRTMDGFPYVVHEDEVLQAPDGRTS